MNASVGCPPTVPSTYSSRIVSQAAMGSWTSPWLYDRPVMRDMSARRVVDFPPASVRVLPSSEA